MAVDMFLKLKGIDGESQDKHGHKNEMELESFSWGMNQTGYGHGGGGSGAGKVAVHDISVTKHIDKASAKLMSACALGTHIEEGLLTVRKAGDKPLEYLKIKMTDVLISSVQNAGHGGDLVSENVTLNFAKFKVEYFEQDSKGAGKAAGDFAYDIKAHSKE